MHNLARRIRKSTADKCPGIAAVNALRRELEHVWGTTLTQKRDRKANSLGYIYNKNAKIEELAAKGDFVAYLRRLHDERSSLHRFTNLHL